MSSILTNNSSMVALQTLRGINQNLAQTQNEISTGKAVDSARDNSALWAISKVMESDVKGFMAISESISLGESSVSVARQASEAVTDLLTEMKGKIVAAQEENVDRTKIQTDIDALSNQIQSVIDAAQFNGLSMVKGQDDINILASLDRSSNGTVTASDITVSRADLSYDAGAFGTGASLVGGAAATVGDASTTSGNITHQAGAGQNFDASSTRDFSNTANSMRITLTTAATADDVYDLNINGTTVSFTAQTGALAVGDIATGLTSAISAAGIEGITATNAAGVITISSTSKFDDIKVSGDNNGGTTQFTTLSENAGVTTQNQFTDAVIAARASELTFSATAGVSDGDGYRVSIGGVNYDYVAGKNETMEDVAKGLKIAIDGAAPADISTAVYQDSTSGAWVLQVDNDGTALALQVNGLAGGTATGGLAGVDDIDVTTDQGVEAALANIETYIDTAIEAAADFGSAQGRLEIQSSFISDLTDSLKSGIGSLVDADMEAASAKLQALQVQQQLAVQALSIANQAPQSILSLFR